MKILTALFFLLNILSCTLFGQDSLVTIYGKTIRVIDNRFGFHDTLQNYFWEYNKIEIWHLRQEITKLKFDHCRHNELDILLYCDTTGSIPIVQLIVGTGLLKTDSIICSIAKSYSGKLKPVERDYCYLIYLKYLFYSKKAENMLAESQRDIFGANVKISLTAKIDSIVSLFYRNPINECEENTVFYDKGIDCFQKGDYGRAIYNFTEAINANPTDMDAMYNLGLSYQKKNKLKKACDCFQEGTAVGDTSSTKAFNKFCSK